MKRFALLLMCFLLITCSGCKDKSGMLPSLTSPNSNYHCQCEATLEDFPSDALLIQRLQSDYHLDTFWFRAYCKESSIYTYPKIGIRDNEGEYYNLEYYFLVSGSEWSGRKVIVSFHFHGGVWDNTYLSKVAMTGELIIETGDCDIECRDNVSYDEDERDDWWHGSMSNSVSLVDQECAYIRLPRTTDPFIRFQLRNASGILTEYGDTYVDSWPFTISLTPQ